MKKLKDHPFIVILVTLAIGGVIGWQARPSEHVENGTETPHHDEAMHQAWTCSMHPQVRQNESGNCPICAMDLVPVGAVQGAIEDQVISMSPMAMKLASVLTTTVGQRGGMKSLQLTGKVQADERNVRTQSAHISGRVEKLEVNFTGERVSKGQVMAYVYSPALTTAQQELLEAHKLRERQPQLMQSAMQKLKNWKLTDHQIQQVLDLGKPMQTFPLRSDFSGMIAHKLVNLGDYVQRGQEIFEVTDLSRVWVLFDIYESDLAWVHKGTILTYTVHALPGELFTGVIDYIDPVIDPKTRVARARLEVSNADGRLKPEMFVSGTLEAQITPTAALVIPKSAVMWTGKRSVVYVQVLDAPEPRFLMREVVLGPSLGDSFVIEEGLQSGEEVVVYGTFSIDAAAQLAGKPSMMNRSRSMASTEAVPYAGNSKQLPLGDAAISALNVVYEEYLRLKDALINDDLQVAKEASFKLVEGVTAVSPDVLDDASRDVWLHYAERLRAAISMASKATSLESFRNSFQTVSNALIEMSNEWHPFGKTLYIQHCPMANDFNGANWLSLDQEIKNPYFGASMLTCGEVTDTIQNYQSN